MPIKRLNSVHVCLVAELRNTKHERSAQEFSRGTTTTAAAGCVKNADGQGAYRLSKRADVQAPLAEIQRECEHINAGSTELAIEGIRHGVPHQSRQQRGTALGGEGAVLPLPGPGQPRLAAAPAKSISRE
jgi:hypothetical protein